MALDVELKEIVRQSEEQERRLFEFGASDELSLKAQHDAYSNVQKLQQSLAEAERERETIQLSPS